MGASSVTSPSGYLCYEKCTLGKSRSDDRGAALAPPADVFSWPGGDPMPRRRALSDRQRKFVGEYLIHLNATRAAVRAGYSPRSAADIGHALLRRHRTVMD